MSIQVIESYLNKIKSLYQTGDAREHSYRGHLETLLNEIINDPSINVINEPRRMSDAGVPDYSITNTKNNVPIAHIEAKDIGDKDLEGKKENKEQFERYKKAFPNLIITDYLQFFFYKNGELKNQIILGTIENSKITVNANNFELFENTIKDVINFVSQTITKPIELAKRMAAKARVMESIIEKSLKSDNQEVADEAFKNQYKIFKSSLIHDLTEEQFADIYAQTIAYGLFAARLHDNDLNNFSRQEAQYLLPKTNPLLRGLFNYIGGVECDDRLVWIVDDLASIFLYADVATILNNDKKSKKINEDPIIHFYETFLSEYNPQLRKVRGVWYTPQPVVNFIVRAVDELLKTEFEINDGLSDESTVKIKIDETQAGSTKGGKQRQKEIKTHKVQILDPATGTGTFLAEAIKLIKEQYYGPSWSRYVEEHLIPRLHGFELLMASYAMAHLKLDLILNDTGYQPQQQQQRLKIYLTNSMEDYHQDTGTLFAQYLANESKEANQIKKETPVMVVIGNPPYSGESANKGDWIMNLMKSYKEEPGGNKKLQERNPKWLNDDYVKFIRFGQYHIEKNGEGILAFINPHGFLDNPTFRGMRWQLLSCFDKIYTIDLHGNTKKKETAPDGSKDVNVFDIQQGVSINLFIKTNKKKAKQLGEVYHYDLYGTRDSKYEFLLENSLKTIQFNKLLNKPPMYFMVPKDFEREKKYHQGIALTDLFPTNSVGIVTARDKILIADNKETLEQNIKENYDIDIDTQFIRNISYRPFDNKLIYYNTDLVERSRENVMQHFLLGENVGLVFKLGHPETNSSPIHISKSIIDFRSWSRPGMQGGDYIAPLYLYPNEKECNGLLERNKPARVPNLNSDGIKQISNALGLPFSNEKQEDENSFSPIDILDYAYARLHSPHYRETYREFLKIDFPYIPLPNPNHFWQFVEIGGALRHIHLLEDESLNKRTLDSKGEGSDKITNKLNSKDWVIHDHSVSLKINEDITLINIPQIAWEFYIGGYQPAQKWLKDRVGSQLTTEGFKHYNRILNALVATHDLMQKIDLIDKV